MTVRDFDDELAGEVAAMGLFIEGWMQGLAGEPLSPAPGMIPEADDLWAFGYAEGVKSAATSAKQGGQR